MQNRTIAFLQKPVFAVVVLMLVTIAITFQSIQKGPKTFQDKVYTHYNNYVIFKQSFKHLLEKKDLYQLHEEEHWDYYKYSPTFALLMAPFAALPDSTGLFLWNALNVIVLCIALWKLPFASVKIRLLALAFILPELITSLQNSQCNALIAGLILVSFSLFEKKRVQWATLFIMLTAFIKIFGIVALILLLFYPNKIKSIAFAAFWFIVLALLPMVVVSPSQLSFLYQSWYNLLLNDHSISYGLSVSGWLHSWFGIQNIKHVITLAGTFLLLLPLIRSNHYTELKFKLLYLSSILLWIVIFNHKAESPTYIIAVTGVAIWYFMQERKTINLFLLIFVLVFTILSPTDLFPKSIRESFLVPYVWKAVPCILVWLKIVYEQLFFVPDKQFSNSLRK